MDDAARRRALRSLAARPAELDAAARAVGEAEASAPGPDGGPSLKERLRRLADADRERLGEGAAEAVAVDRDWAEEAVRFRHLRTRAVAAAAAEPPADAALERWAADDAAAFAGILRDCARRPATDRAR
ncbi:MAG TPA: hypothetical protein VEI02_17095 [Planctomycetota bacterium]|nr:hypothetical protein [Planctomycetota bacterium]